MFFSIKEVIYLLCGTDGVFGPWRRFMERVHNGTNSLHSNMAQMEILRKINVFIGRFFVFFSIIDLCLFLSDK